MLIKLYQDNDKYRASFYIVKLIKNDIQSAMNGGAGKKGTVGAAQKTYLTRVLLHDNVSQRQLLDMRLSSIATQQRRAGRMWENHKKAFVSKQYR